MRLFFIIAFFVLFVWNMASAIIGFRNDHPVDALGALIFALISGYITYLITFGEDDKWQTPLR